MNTTKNTVKHIVNVGMNTYFYHSKKETNVNTCQLTQKTNIHVKRYTRWLSDVRTFLNAFIISYEIHRLHQGISIFHKQIRQERKCNCVSAIKECIINSAEQADTPCFLFPHLSVRAKSMFAGPYSLLPFKVPFPA